ncbi:hypothetical protein CEXT_567031 [Caerostris extrusa]|uniref:Uncharacterized protein n=1 Tax=Caerostris extrusa TaxID=172846 RepID=A0AAV4RNQ6_CAEEX|nr:hypothetical protein CEXT_567031 [Caerostris extrusa]
MTGGWGAGGVPPELSVLIPPGLQKFSSQLLSFSWGLRDSRPTDLFGRGVEFSSHGIILFCLSPVEGFY